MSDATGNGRADGRVDGQVDGQVDGHGGRPLDPATLGEVTPGQLAAREAAELALAGAEHGDLDAAQPAVTSDAVKGVKALPVLRRGLRESPELRRGMIYTVTMALAGAGGRLLVPLLVQQILDHGFDGPDGFRPGFVFGLSAVAAAMVMVTYVTARLTFLRMVRASEEALYRLRVRVFARIHDLSIAEQSTRRRGMFLSRVTNDVDTLAQFFEWGWIVWIVGLISMAATFVVMLVYSWRLALVTLFVVLPIVVVLRWLQQRILTAYDVVRTRVGETATEFSESVMGAAVIRAYGVQERVDRRLKRAIRRQFEAERGVLPYMAVVFPTADFFGALALAAVLAVGVLGGPSLGLTAGGLVAFLFMVGLFVEPLNELAESLEWSQTAIAGWRKVLAVLDLPIGVPDPATGRHLPVGALGIDVDRVTYSYVGGRPVLLDVDVDVAPGAHVAIVGETGSGKTTMAKLLCRLADPDRGRILVGGVDLREAEASSRRTAIRLVPQDGFLFDTTVRENIRIGRDGTTPAEVDAAVAALGLDGWVAGLPDGLDTRVGERGEHLSVGERQLVALARAELAQPGLLILDEATSAVDPETERVLAEAMRRLAEGRTTVTIAHRLSTAEHADLVLVFDAGRLAERGTHDELLAHGGVYAGLHASWVGNITAA
jgi:putative ABC transport system ATP-binding protein